MRFQLLQWWFWSATTRAARSFAPSMRRWCRPTSFAPSMRRWCSPTTHAFALTPSPRRLCNLRAARTAAEEQELLLTEPAVNAFIVAEVKAFVRERSYASEDQEAVTSDDVALITEATRTAYRAADAADVLGSLSTGLAFLRPRFEGADLEGPLQRARLSPYQLAHHITDMYHHRCFRGADEALAATGRRGRRARAVGLPPAAAGKRKTTTASSGRPTACAAQAPAAVRRGRVTPAALTRADGGRGTSSEEFRTSGRGTQPGATWCRSL